MKEFLWKVSGNKRCCNLMKVFSLICFLGAIICVFFNLFVVSTILYLLFFILYNFATYLVSINLFSKVIYKKCSIKLLYLSNRKNLTRLVTTILLGITMVSYYVFCFYYFIFMLVFTIFISIFLYFVIAKNVEKRNLNKINIK